MTEIAKHKAKGIRPDRFIGQLQGKAKGPTLLFFGGIHGNEMAGTRAIEKVFKDLGPHTDEVKGSIFGIRGNIPAQLSQKRFLDDDLNRLWTTERVAAILGKPAIERNVEESELFEINALLTEVIR
ncbi:MAG: succinylglutamate desuccinylase/aspartoacylase family protein, partial [Flavobacteriaceae bacterium]